MTLGLLPYLAVSGAALAASALTLFSGFGLGTLLMPVLALFFPVTTAVAATAVVHLANNLFKLGLLWSKADLGVVWRFALPAAPAAVLGAQVLVHLADRPVLAEYFLAGRLAQVTWVKLVVGILICLFALLEMSPVLEKKLFLGRRHLALGGVVSGFFGGLSGNQGAFRSALLIRLGLDKEAFVATGVVCAVVVDLFRLAAYGLAFYTRHFETLARGGGFGLILAGILAAFAGAYLGRQVLKKMTLRTVQLLVAATLMVLGLALASGLA